LASPQRPDNKTNDGPRNAPQSARQFTRVFAGLLRRGRQGLDAIPVGIGIERLRKPATAATIRSLHQPPTQPTPQLLRCTKALSTAPTHLSTRPPLCAGHGMGSDRIGAAHPKALNSATLASRRPLQPSRPAAPESPGWPASHGGRVRVRPVAWP